MQAAETPFPGGGGPAARSAPSASKSVRAGLGGRLDPESRAGGRLAGGAWVKGGRLRAGGERRGGLDRVRREEGHHSCGTVSRMDARPGRVVAAAGRTAESGRLNFGIPGGTECVCVRGRETLGPRFLRRAGYGGRGPIQHLFGSISADLYAPGDGRSRFQIPPAFPNPAALRFGVVASAIKGITENSIQSERGTKNSLEREAVGGRPGGFMSVWGQGWVWGRGWVWSRVGISGLSGGVQETLADFLLLLQAPGQKLEGAWPTRAPNDSMVLSGSEI